MKQNLEIKKIENLFFLFFILLITEGIFRKWIFGEGSIGNIFMVLRDPIVLLIILKCKRFNIRLSTTSRLILIMSCITFLLTITFGHKNIFVALFAARIPMYFIGIEYCGKVLSLSSIISLGKKILYLFIPCVVLCILQFLSPPGAFVNNGRGVEGDFSRNAYEIMMRPSGLFTSSVLQVDFYFIALSFIFIFYIYNNKIININKSFLFACIVAYIISIPVSVSRTHLFMTITSFLIISIFGLTKDKLIKTSMLVIIICIIILLLHQSSLFNIFTDTFMTRLNGANKTEGGAFNSIINRTFGFAINVFNEDIPIFGWGDGYCTNFGVKMIYNVVGVANMTDMALVRRLEASEMEWSRLIMENGPIFGVTWIILRIKLGFNYLVSAINSKRRGNKLPILMLPPIFVWVCTQQLKVPGHLGFFFIAGVCFIALLKPYNCNNTYNNKEKKL